MRWVCRLYPQLPLEVCAPPPDHPCAVVEPRGSRRPLTYVNAAARECGIEPGMSQSSAAGLVPELMVFPRRPNDERAALQALACSAYRFGSPVVIDEAALAVWVEVERSISLFGGWKILAQALLQPDGQEPYTLRMGAAPTLSAAYLLARVSEKPQRVVARVSGIPAALSPLPLVALPFDRESLQTLHGAGLRSIGEILAIPGSSLGKRIGAKNLLALQRLLGQAPEAWQAWQPPQAYRRRFEFEQPVENTEALLFPLRTAIGELVAYLKARDLAVQHFQLRLIDWRKRVVIHPLGLLSPTRDPQRLQLILREQLDRIQIEDGVVEVSLEADRFEPATAIQDDLFSDVSTRMGERLTELRERLAARLGSEAVQQLGISHDQRPEAAQVRREKGAAGRGTDHPTRPLWLLEKPQKIQPRRILSSPERIELGWWDEKGPRVQRDYVLAEDQYGRLCWAYREPGSIDWQLHGLWQ